MRLPFEPFHSTHGRKFQWPSFSPQSWTTVRDMLHQGGALVEPVSPVAFSVFVNRCSAATCAERRPRTRDSPESVCDGKAYVQVALNGQGDEAAQQTAAEALAHKVISHL